MGMDELYLLGKARGMITDLERRSFVEVLPDRKKQTIMEYLSTLPNKEGVQVYVIVIWDDFVKPLVTSGFITVREW